jgi:hypothetical protein
MPFARAHPDRQRCSPLFAPSCSHSSSSRTCQSLMAVDNCILRSEEWQCLSS